MHTYGMILYIFNTFLILFELLQLLGKALWVMLEYGFRKFVPRPKKNVAGEVVLITGAGHGLGRELALRFSKMGARLVLWDINQKGADKVAEEIKEDGGVAYSYQCDISDEIEVEKVAERVRKDIGDVTILVNNAGILNCQPLLSLNSQQIRRTFEVNLMAHYWTVRQFLPHMLEAGRGHIVAIASIASLIGTVNMTDYCASKYGVRGLMEALSEELHAMGKNEIINLTTVCPFTFNTGLAQKPISRFPKILPILTVEEVADGTMNAILRNKFIAIMPASMGRSLTYCSILPHRVKHMFQEFLKYESLAHTT